ncbi:hypothetical protein YASMINEVIRUS_261 [Yasminevirus sp. GU-2018]|uniref:Uncharacterized protein n=1 Tax=Yasminevirus sp. GU-2018 TaxID=2420051 RepID=A0A5K0U7A8_9VIRU|nr:hypothetical protein YASMINEVIRUS_261 [Yasminevirus sp. GU-2018]
MDSLKEQKDFYKSTPVATVKFRPNQQVSIVIVYESTEPERSQGKKVDLDVDWSTTLATISMRNFTDIGIIIEKVINRARMGWTTYQVVLPNTTVKQSVAERIRMLDASKILDTTTTGGLDPQTQTRRVAVTHTINYTTFREVCKEFKVTELVDRFVPMTDECLLRDLEFMQEEVVTVKIQMNLMKQKGETSRLAFYEDLIGNRPHIMFQLPTKEDYDAYIAKITSLVKSDKVQKLCKNELESLRQTINDHASNGKDTDEDQDSVIDEAIESDADDVEDTDDNRRSTTD